MVETCLWTKGSNPNADLSMPGWTSTASVPMPRQGRDLLPMCSSLGSDTKPGLEQRVKCPWDGRNQARATTSTNPGGNHSFVSSPKRCPSSSSSEHQGCSCGKSSAGRGWCHHSLCLEKVLLHWVALSNSTFFRGFIASFQSDCAGERVQKQMDPLSVSLLHIISYSLGAIKLPGRTNLQACAVPYF